MSVRLTSKTRTHALPRSFHPPSPPETESDLLGLAQNSVHDSTLVGIETPAERFRRTSALAYRSSASQREQRPVLKSFKWLVLVLPPSSLPQEPVLGSTLSTSPPGRLAGGTLMPLFPTLYAQLAAIAREYGMPSTVGLCVYLHMADNGINFTPRLSDEAWPIVWAQYFTADSFERPPSAQMLPPISGRIEFDIDVRKAKWYTAWAIGHIRQLSDETYGSSDRRSLFEGDDRDATESEIGLTKPSAASFSTVRQAPRRLSLLVRREMDLPLIKAPRTPSRLAQFEIESTSSRITDKPEKAVLHKLSPVPQADEPASGTQRDVNAFVQQWRAGHTPTAAPMIPPSPGLETLKSRVHADAESSAVMISPTLDLADYTWSISSQGPPSPISPTISEPVDLRRHPRHTPDLGARMLEDVPNTPTTATTWGAPSVYPETPSSVDRLPSPDIGQRAMEYSALTPTTATTWGAPLSYPPSPTTELSWIPTPDIAHRAFSPSMPPLPTYESQTLDVPSRPRSEISPRSPGNKAWDVVRQAVESGVVFRHVWPYNTRKPAPRPAEISLLAPSQGRMGARSGSLSPVTAHPKDGGLRSPASKSWDTVRQAVSNGIIFQHVWPYNARKPTIRSAKVASIVPLVEQTNAGAEPIPAHKQPVSVHLTSSYPRLNIYEVAYPYFDIYPALPLDRSLDRISPVLGQTVTVTLPSCYPNLQVYPPQYPHLVIYPPVHTTRPMANRPSKAIENRSLSVRLPPIYPSFNIYGTCYPEFLIYPPVSLTNQTVAIDCSTKALPVRLPPSYPSFDIYGSAYPELLIYPPVVLVKPTPAPLTGSSKSMSVRLPPVYPSFDIYGSAYPELLIYPSIGLPLATSSTSHFSPKALPVRLPPVYPSFNIYGTSYPSLEIYPPLILSIPAQHSTAAGNLTKGLPITLQTAYPVFSLYPPCYPNLEIYPPVNSSVNINAVHSSTKTSFSCATTFSDYPHFNLYPAVYPFLVIYPTVARLDLVNHGHKALPSMPFMSNELVAVKDAADESTANTITSMTKVTVHMQLPPTNSRSSAKFIQFPPSSRARSASIIAPAEGDASERSRKKLHDLIFGGSVGIQEPQTSNSEAFTSTRLGSSSASRAAQPRQVQQPPSDSERGIVQVAAFPVLPSLDSAVIPPPGVSIPPRSRSRSSTISKPSIITTNDQQGSISRKPSLSSRHQPFHGRAVDAVILEEASTDGQQGTPINASPRHVLDFVVNQPVDTPSKVARSRTWSPAQSLSPVSPRSDGQSDQGSPKSPIRLKMSSPYIQQKQALLNSSNGSSPTIKPHRQSGYLPSRPVSRLDLSKYSFQ